MAGVTNISNDEIQLNLQYTTKKNGITEKTWNLGKKIFAYLLQNQSAFAISIWSYLCIEVGGMAFQGVPNEKYIYDIDTCRQVLCHHWDNNNITETKMIPNLQFRCDPFEEDYYQPYSFVECIIDLCKYANSIGKKFYACVESTKTNNIKSDSITELWGKICPKIQLRHPDALKELGYLNNCIKKLCKYNHKHQINLDKDILDLCQFNSSTKLYELLNKITESMHKLQKTIETPDTWTKTNTIISGISGIVGAAAGTAATILTYRASNFAFAVGRAIPSIAAGLEAIARTTTEAATAIVHDALSTEGEMIPMETRNVLNEISDELVHSLSYYSAESQIDLEAGNLANFKGGSNVLSETIVEEAVAAAGTGEAGEGGIGIIVIKSALNVFASLLKSNTNQVNNKKVIKTVKTVATSVQPYLSSSLQDCLQSHIFSSNILKSQIGCVKKYLPVWNKRFCFFKAPELLACRYSPIKKGVMISIPLDELQKQFSENVYKLCDYFSKVMWCNVNKIFEMLSFTRSISLTQSCHWDQLALKIEQDLDNTYKLEAIGSCYNQTGWVQI